MNALFAPALIQEHGLFTVENVKELTAYGALLVLFGFFVWRIARFIDKALETFKDEQAIDRERCDKQMSEERSRADAQLAKRDELISKSGERYERIVTALERLEHKT